ELQERMARFGLQLHPEKTRLIEFGRFAAERRKARGEGSPETFNFLGFTHIWGTHRTTGGFTIIRITISKRMAAKLKQIHAELRRRRHDPLAETAKWLQSVVGGYFQYHAIPGNQRRLGAFRKTVLRLWLRQIRRRSQRSRWTWDRFLERVAGLLPEVSVLHPSPHLRFDVRHAREEPCALNGPARFCAGGAEQSAFLPRPKRETSATAKERPTDYRASSRPYRGHVIVVEADYQCILVKTRGSGCGR